MSDGDARLDADSGSERLRAAAVPADALVAGVLAALLVWEQLRELPRDLAAA